MVCENWQQSFRTDRHKDIQTYRHTDKKTGVNRFFNLVALSRHIMCMEEFVRFMAVRLTEELLI